MSILEQVTVEHVDQLIGAIKFVGVAIIIAGIFIGITR